MAVAGTNAMVISCPLANRRSWGSPLVSVPLPFDAKLGQLTTMTTPGLLASGVPFGQTSPLVYAVLPGYCRVDEVSRAPCTRRRTCPAWHCRPDSELFFGAMVTTPLPLATMPVWVLATPESARRDVGVGREIGLDRAADVDAQRGVPDLLGGRRTGRGRGLVGPLIPAESDQQEAHDADQGQTGVPVDRHLTAIGPPATGGGRALHPFSRRFARHDRTTPYNLGSGALPARGRNRAIRARHTRQARTPIPSATRGSSARRHPCEDREANRRSERWCSTIIR